MRIFVLDDVLDVGIELVAYLSQWNLILSAVLESQRLLWLGLDFILLLIFVRVYSFLCDPLCSFPLHIIFLSVLPLGWESEFFAVGIRMSQLMFHKLINFKTLALIEAYIIRWMLFLEISEFSRRIIHLIPFSLVVWSWIYVISSSLSLHFFGTTAFVYVYFVFVLFRRFCLSIVSHIHAIILSKLISRFLYDKLRLSWSGRC